MAGKVILAMPTIFGIYQVIADNLRYHGFEVTVLAYVDKKYRYRNLWDRLKKIYHRDLLGDKNYKRELLFGYVGKGFLDQLEQIEGQADYCLMIWPGVWPNSFMQVLRDKSKMMVHYNWEALDFLQEDFDKIRYMDKFFFFDPYDIGKRPEYADKLIPTTSFYFDCYPQEERPSESLFFLGSHAKQRIGDIRAFYRAAKETGLPVDFHIAAQDPKQAEAELGLPDIRYFTFAEALPYRENLKMVSKAGILVDFLNNKHHGLSLRIFESVGFDKKLITTNHTVVHYDFYHPDNIFVWNGNNLEELKIFLLKPYQPLPSEIKQKYSFGNWIRFAFGIESYQKIELPLL